MRNRHLHPSAAKLEQWLEHGSPPIEEHIESCLRCSARLEELTDGESLNTLRQALVQATAPPTDLNPRLTEAISRRMKARQDWALVGDLFGVSWQTIRVLTQEQEPE